MKATKSKEPPVRLTMKEIAYQLSCSVDTVRRRLRRFSITTKEFLGLQPVFPEETVSTLRDLWNSHVEELRKKTLPK